MKYRIRNVHDKVVGANNLNGGTYVKTNLKNVLINMLIRT